MVSLQLDQWVNDNRISILEQRINFSIGFEDDHFADLGVIEQLPVRSVSNTVRFLLRPAQTELAILVAP
jgi:hypothetical protein